MSDEFQPYVGPRPFERKDAEMGRFWGRDGEARDLLSRVIAHTTVLLYSQSGAGKTSLINAKLIPCLETKGFEILKPARVRGLRPPNIKREQIQNIFVFNVLRSWDDNETDPTSLVKTSIAEFWSNRQKDRQQKGLPTDVPCIAVFDQFEELFTSYQERWEDRQNFFEQLGEFLEANRLMRAVFVMREDFIAELDPYVTHLPENLRTRFRLESLREDEALLAVTGPLEGSEYAFAPDVAEQLVNNLLIVPVETPAGLVRAKGEFVEPVQLQVVCQSLWEKCQSSWQDLPPSQSKLITEGHVKSFGDVDVALATFYENAIAKVIECTGVNEGKLRSWFEQTLITPVGTRGAVYRGQCETGSIPTAVADELVNQRLVTGELRGGGSKWLELTHDRLIEPIKASNERWRLKYSEGESIRKLLEARASQWVLKGRANSELLNQAELLEAQRWLDSPSAADLGYSNRLLALIQASKAAVDEAARKREEALAEEQRLRAEVERERAEEKERRINEQAKATKRLRRLAAALAVMFLFAAGATVWARHQRKQAVSNAETADRNARQANEARALASTERQVAEDRQKEAEEKTKALAEAYAKLKVEKERTEAETRRAKNAIAGKVEAVRRLEKRKREEAVLLAQFAIRYADASIWAKEGELLEKSGDLDRARGYYRGAANAFIEIGVRENVEGLLSKAANIYHSQGRLEDEKTLRNIAAKYPKNVVDVLREAARENGVESAISNLRESLKRQPDKYYSLELEVNSFGYDLLKSGKVKEAIEVFKFNVENYPHRSNTYDSLGEAYMIAGNKDLAIRNYEKALALNPTSLNAKDKLKQLRNDVVTR